MRRGRAHPHTWRARPRRVSVGGAASVVVSRAYLRCATLLVTVTGDHFTMLLMPDVLNLAAVVEAWAASATAGVPTSGS